MNTVAGLLKSKTGNVLTVSPCASIYEALSSMAEISAGTAVVVHEENVAGIISERDVIRKVILENKDINAAKVEDIMTAELFAVTPETSLDECLALFTEKRIRHLPVLNNGELSGIVSIGDVVKCLIKCKDFTLSNLEAYITGVA